ncbi:MAG: PGN_0703 family putative restriction endonuclease [Methylocella sp.]
MLDKKGYVSEASQNLIEGVRLRDFEADLRQGDGNEMEGKFRAAHSSSALVVNTFARFKSDPAALRLPVGGGFASLSFERKCPHGLAGRRSPNLDVVAEGPSGVVAIESKCLEPLTPHVANFAPAYYAEIRDERRRTAWCTAWYREMQRLGQDPCAYRWLDAAQLVKHAFGVAYTFLGRPMTLLYLFWEPSNPEAYPIFAEHQAEVTRFAASIGGGGPEFVFMSYPDLWRSWDACTEPDWLRAHVGRLRKRYGVAVAEGETGV